MQITLKVSAMALAVASLAATSVLFGPAIPALALLAAIPLFASMSVQRAHWSPLLAIAILLLAAPLALAADGTTPETVAAATGDATKVTWAYGAAIGQWASAVGAAIFALVMWMLRQLPAQVYAIIVSLRAEQLLQKAVDYGVNAVVGASKDKTLTVDVGNEVLAHAVQYVLDNAPAWLQAWLGGPDQIVKKIFARLNLDANAGAPNTAQILDAASAKV